MYATWLSCNHAAKKCESQFYLAISHLAIYIGYQPNQPTAKPGFPAAPAIAPGVFVADEAGLASRRTHPALDALR